MSLLQRQRRYFSATEVGAAVRPLLADHAAVLHPDLVVNHRAWLRDGTKALVNARWLPPARPTKPQQFPHVGLVGDQLAYVALPPAGIPDCLPEDIADYAHDCEHVLPQRQAGGRIIEYPWDLIEHNAEALEIDYQMRRGQGGEPSQVAVVGTRERLVIDLGARVDPMVVADTTGGPVLIDRGAVVQAFSTLEGPCYIGPETWIRGARICRSTIGPACRVGGEVEASVVQGYSNKAHDGFLGHSYLGEWVNLGAGTQVSDLRNDYGPASVVVAGEKMSTQLIKVGAFIGDHTKTGLNTVLNTGTTVGPFCHLLMSATCPPKTIPPFASFWHGRLQDRADFRQLFSTAATVMRRRNREWTASHADFYLALYDQTAPCRRQLLWESEQRRLRRIV
jgi:UDP-N-acetylglucosamine diphosphorylase/glucosamine-1-phosphate N-acetyltransferase